MSNSIKKNSYIWNSVSGMINAGQSAIILIFIAYNYGTVEAGVFSIAYALGNLMFSLGRYGVRNFQVTDVREKYRFSDYFYARIIVVGLTVVLSFVYSLVKFCAGSYDLTKSGIVFLICIWKLIDSFEDVFWGMYQQKGRLDIGAKFYSLRLIFSTILFCGLSMMKIRFEYVVLSTVVASFVVSYCFLKYTFSRFGEKILDFQGDKVKGLLVDCASLCLGTTLQVYVGNIPKYAIDWYMDDKSQALFGYIMMPAFAIMVLNNFIYQPIVREFGELYYGGKKGEFISRVVRQCFVVVGLTFFVMAVCFFLGIPILNLLYNIDLQNLKPEFMLLIVGGGLYALVSFLMVPLTTMRLQKYIAISFAVVAVIGLLVGKFLVSGYGMMGASWLYILVNGVLMVLLGGVLIIKVSKLK